jgi:preprotein translocase subunit SecF
MIRFFSKADYQFIANRRKAFVFSAALILVGIASLIAHGGPRYNIDFTGGALVQVRFSDPVSVQQVRDALSGADLGGAEITYFGSDREILVRAQTTEMTGTISEVVDQTLVEAFPDQQIEIRRTEEVGPKVGSELRSKAIYAIVFGLAALLLYISIRFQFRFAVAAVAALVHDVLATLGAFSILNLDISLPVIAAFLTIIGYSLNDTIVVFDRIREDLKLYRRETYNRVVNLSINQTLSRTIITSLTTFVVVFVLYLFGGSVLHDFAFALVFGVLIGTYSSIFVASPILVEWENKKPRRSRR